MMPMASQLRAAKIKTFVTILLVGFILTSYVSHYLGVILHFDYPLNTMFFDPLRAGDDLFSPLTNLRSGNPYAPNGSSYFPACILFLLPFLPLTDAAAIAVYASVVIGISLAFSYLNFRRFGLDSPTNIIVTLVFVFLSYPFLFCLERANLEGLSFIFFMGFAWFFRKRNFWLSASALGIAASIKLYPLVFGALLLRERRWRELLYACALASFLNIAPAAVLPGGVISTFAGAFENQRIFNMVVGMTYGAVPFGLSLLSVIKIFIYLLTDGNMPSYIFRLYTIPCAIITIYCFYFTIRNVEKLWEALFFVFAPWLVFPQVSYAYKLIWLLVPACLMFEDDELSLVDIWCFGLLFIPKTIFPTGLTETSVAVFVDPLMIIVIAVRIYLRRAVRKMRPIESSQIAN